MTKKMTRRARRRHGHKNTPSPFLSGRFPRWQKEELQIRVWWYRDAKYRRAPWAERFKLNQWMKRISMVEALYV